LKDPISEKEKETKREEKEGRRDTVTFETREKAGGHAPRNGGHEKLKGSAKRGCPLG